VVPLGVFGLVLISAAVAAHARAHHNYWFTCRLQPSSATIVVEPTHPRFDDAARELFLRTLK
jgi:hypothetical protein